jgi:hypothetical protein
MAKLQNVEVIASETHMGLTQKLNSLMIEIQSRKNDIKIQYVPPTIDPETTNLVWSALVEELKANKT